MALHPKSGAYWLTTQLLLAASISISFVAAASTNGTSTPEDTAKCAAKVFKDVGALQEIDTKCLEKAGVKADDVPDPIEDYRRFDDKCMTKCVAEEHGWMKMVNNSKLEWDGIKTNMDKTLSLDAGQKERLIPMTKKCLDTYETAMKDVKAGDMEKANCKEIKEFTICYSEALLKMC